MAELVRIGFNPEDRFMTAVGHTLVVITQTGNVFGADVVNRELQPVFKFGGAKIGFNPEDRFVVTVGNTIVVITQNGSVFGSEVTGRELGPVFQFSGSKIGFNPQDRFMVAMGQTLVVITSDGNVFGADVVRRDVGPVFQINDVPVKPLTLDLRANPNHLQINPELVIIGHGFTANERFHYTVHNWPKIQDIHNQGALDVNGSFERTESRDFASIRIDVDVPDIEVTAVDEATGRSITASVSAEPFIARFG
jgi:hypothetical protein